MFQETISDEYIVIQSGTSEGSQIKYRKDNYWYKKDNRGHEGRTEYLCSKLLSFSTLEQSEYVEYEQGYINQNMGCRSKNFLNPGDLLVFNDTKVIPARLYGKKETGGAIELLIERITSQSSALTHIRASKAPKSGNILNIDGGKSLKVTGRQGDLFMVETVDGSSLLDILYDCGHIPLPPYIDRPDEPLDKDRYQTVYSKHPGAVAAPTAGLHFDEKQLADLKEYGVNMAFVTLHVGAGTFQPVREDDITEHHMHSEFVHLSKEVADAVIATHKAGKRVIAVGTTAVRSLESAAQAAAEEAAASDTEY